MDFKFKEAVAVGDDIVAYFEKGRCATLEPISYNKEDLEMFKNKFNNKEVDKAYKAILDYEDRLTNYSSSY